MTGESKQGEYKSDINDLLDVVQEFCMSDAFEQEFEMFAKEHAGTFRRSLEFSVHSAEHPMEFHDVYRQYLSKFEGMIEDFIVKNGYSVKDFYDECKTILDSDELFGRKRFFIETMLATSEYENFFLLMQSEMKLQQHANKK